MKTLKENLKFWATKVKIRAGPALVLFFAGIVFSWILATVFFGTPVTPGFADPGGSPYAPDGSG